MSFQNVIVCAECRKITNNYMKKKKKNNLISKEDKWIVMWIKLIMELKQFNHIMHFITKYISRKLNLVIFKVYHKTSNLLPLNPIQIQNVMVYPMLVIMKKTTIINKILHKKAVFKSKYKGQHYNDKRRKNTRSAK